MTTLPVVLKNHFGEGGRGLGTTPTARHRPIGEVLHAVQLDLAALRPAPIALPATVASAGYVQAEAVATNDLLDEVVAALTILAGTLVSPVLPANANATYDLTGGLVLTIAVNGVNRSFAFQDSDFADPANATAPEVAGAINSRNGLTEYGVVASAVAGPAVTLTGAPGGDKSLLAIAGGAESEFDYLDAGLVLGAGLALNLVRVDG